MARVHKPKRHPEDFMMARDINKADYFTAHIRNGREVRETVRDIPTYEQALAEAAKLEARFSTFGRKALVYAVVGTYSVLCTPELMELAAELAAADGGSNGGA